MDGTVHTAAAITFIRFERHLDHRIGKVWAAVTQPDQLQQWLAFPAEIEPRVGGVGVATATRPYFQADKGAPVEDFVAEADRHPVFELLPVDADRPTVTVDADGQVT